MRLSYLSELIEKFCGDGVEWREIGEVCDIQTGKLNANAMNENGKYLFFTCNEFPSRIDTYAFDGKAIMISGNGSNVGHVNYYEGKFNAYQRTYVLLKFDECINVLFLFYYLKSNLRDYLKINSKKGSVPYITLPVIKNFKIPIPPLEVQKEIVRILDKFTNLIYELTRELTKRKKQYEYYRDKLLTFGDGVPRVKLKDISQEMFRGNGIKRDELKNSGIPCVRYGEIYTKYGIHFDKCVSFTDENIIKNKKYIKYGDLLFAITGESVEEIGKTTAYLGNEQALVGGDILVLRHNQNPKFLSYALSTNEALKQKRKGKIKSKVVHTDAKSIGNIEIPLPPLEEQERIANILDKFDKLCNDISQGIPAEIEMRQKQYEYYRDKLLTF